MPVVVKSRKRLGHTNSTVKLWSLDWPGIENEVAPDFVMERLI